MRLLWTDWEIKRFDSEPRKDGLSKDSMLVELSHDLIVTRSIVITGFMLGLITLLVLWALHLVEEGFTSFFWALACYASGALLGFLFGIPRVFQSSSQSDQLPPKPDLNSGESRSNYQMIVNTNLDDVSDWLTKIVVGVGLVELEKIPGLVYRLATVIGGETGKKHVPFIISVLLYFTTVGFMSGYLTTRMFFQRAFRIADVSASGSRDRLLVGAQIVKTTETVSAAAAG